MSATMSSSDLLGARLGPIDADAEPLLLELAERRLFGGGPLYIGRYPVTGLLGSGGMGVVLAGVDEALGREVAIKVLLRAGGDVSTQALREGRALAALTHPNIVEVYDTGVDERGAFVVMQKIDGPTLDAWLQTRPPRARVLEALTDAAHGLAAAHRAGFVHGDFKPSNVLIGSDGRTRVADFGLASRVTARSDSAIGGTPGYAAPEGRVSPAADQYALCVTMYKALVGTMPRGSEAPWPADVPRWLRRIVRRGLNRDPRRRHGSVDALIGALRHRRRTRVALAVVALGLGGLVAAAPGPRRCPDAELRVAEVLPRRTRDAIAGQFAASGRSHARKTLELVETKLEAQATDWAEASTRACESVPPPSDALRGCLADRRRRLLATIEVLADASATTIDNAVLVVRGLGSDPGCDARRSDGASPPPRMRSEVAVLEARFARVQAHARARETESALALAQHLVDETESLGFAPLTARVRALRGRLLSELDRSDEAVIALEDALWSARAAGAWDAAADAAVALFAIAVSSDRRSKADRWLEDAEALTARDDAAPQRRAELLRYRALLAEVDGDLAAALALARGAVDVIERRLGPDHHTNCAALSALGQLLVEAEMFDEAAEVVARQIDLARRVFGPRHPRLARGLRVRAAVASAQGDMDAAEAWAVEAVEILSESRGAAAHRTLDARMHLGQLLGDAGKRERAIEVLAETLALLESSEVAGTRAEMVLRTSLGRIQLGVDVESARANLSAAVEIAERLQLAEHPHVASALSLLGDAQRLAGDLPGARASANASLQMRRNLGRKGLIAAGLEGVARVTEDEGNAPGAVALYEDAAVMWERADGDHRSDAAAARKLAELIRSAG